MTNPSTVVKSRWKKLTKKRPLASKGPGTNCLSRGRAATSSAYVVVQPSSKTQRWDVRMGPRALNKQARIGREEENVEPGEPEEEEEENYNVCWILNQRNQNRQESFHGDTMWVTQV
ncbi:hypothetical protein MRX96_036267 [Rhipicephalus microplus]